MKLALKLFLILACSYLLFLDHSPVHCRGGRKKKKGSGSGSIGLYTGPTCEQLGLNCNATCCLDNMCAEDIEECAGYFNREFQEIYVGFGTIICLAIGIPIAIKFFNCCLLYKFCQKQDEASNSKVGGYSVCEILSKLCIKEKPGKV